MAREATTPVMGSMNGLYHNTIGISTVRFFSRLFPFFLICDIINICNEQSRVDGEPAAGLAGAASGDAG